MMPQHHIGTLDPISSEILKLGVQEQDTSRVNSNQDFLDSKLWRKAQLINKRSVSWDARIFTFKLDHETQSLGLPTGQHLMMKIKDDNSSQNKSIIRAYTPISETSQRGTLELLVKIYYDMSNPDPRNVGNNPSKTGGKMTMALDRLVLNSTVEFKGPVGKLQYLGKGRVLLNAKERQVSAFRMICGGSGITPIFQVLRAVMQDEEDNTECVVLDSNRMEEDILCREELDRFVQTAADLKSQPIWKARNKCEVLHTLTKPLPTWSGLRGRISVELLKRHCSPRKDCLVLICGPGSMERAVRELLTSLGWHESDLVFF